MNTIDFTFSDRLGGYVQAFDADSRSVRLQTIDGRELNVRLADVTWARFVSNLGGNVDWIGDLHAMFQKGVFCWGYGPIYPPAGEQKEFLATGNEWIFATEADGTWRADRADWWPQQIQALGDFYYRAQFGDDLPDYRNYRTMLKLDGDKTSDTKQECDTISRLVYGFASAYMLTGDEKFFQAADAGTKYLQNEFTIRDRDPEVILWYHLIDGDKKVLPSQFDDDYNCIPCYEQIYALAGPVQTYRITGDPSILDDAAKTVKLFKKYYLDPDKGSYFSHIDPETLSPTADYLKQYLNDNRKNWNSVGDHAPAYLINLFLATGDEGYADFLQETFDTIEEHFPDFENSPFVQEKFFADWSHDKQWKWQQDRGVVGHNLKIAWNIMRMHALRPEAKYETLARRIAREMEAVGMDPIRGGWYDVLERQKKPGEAWYRFCFHDRKAWWQQEQGILAYYILAGMTGEDHYLKIARESSAFYNAFFLDWQDGAVYFNVLANGIPFLMETERFKGSHSMSGYHSFELAFLSAVYGNLLCLNQPLTLHFKPVPSQLPGGVLRVAPDLLPAGRVKLTEVTVDGGSHSDFDAAAMTINLPAGEKPVKVTATLTPAG